MFDASRAKSLPDLNGARAARPAVVAGLSAQPTSLGNIVMRVKQFKISPTPETTV